MKFNKTFSCFAAVMCVCVSVRVPVESDYIPHSWALSSSLSSVRAQMFVLP